MAEHFKEPECLKVGGPLEFQHETNAEFLALIEEERENINKMVGGNLKLKKIVDCTKYLVAGYRYDIIAEFEDESGQISKYSFKLYDRPWDQPENRVYDHEKVE